MRAFSKGIGCLNTLSFLVFLSAFSVASAAMATDHNLIFVSDFYGKPGPVEEGDDAYRVAHFVAYLPEFLQDTLVDDVLATEVNNYSGIADEYSHIDRVWWSFKRITHAVPGNADYYVANAQGFKSYFGPTTYGSFTRIVGDTRWKIIGLDSNLAADQNQLNWLDQELDNEQCSIVYFHHPRWSNGENGSNTAMDPIWRVLAAHNVELAISGHDHDFEQFWPKNADGNWDYNTNGVVQVVAGVGGAGLRNKVDRDSQNPAFASGSYRILAQNTDPPSQPGVLMIKLYDFEPGYLGVYYSAQGEILHHWWGQCY